MHLSLKDVWLDYFITRQNFISELKSGDSLTVKDNEYLDSKEKSVLKFSKLFIDQIKNMKAKNYILKSAQVNFIVYWRKEDSEQEVKIVLPELYFERTIET